MRTGSGQVYAEEVRDVKYHRIPDDEGRDDSRNTGFHALIWKHQQNNNNNSPS